MFKKYLVLVLVVLSMATGCIKKDEQSKQTEKTKNDYAVEKGTVVQGDISVSYTVNTTTKVKNDVSEKISDKSKKMIYMRENKNGYFLLEKDYDSQNNLVAGYYSDLDKYVMFGKNMKVVGKMVTSTITPQRENYSSFKDNPMFRITTGINKKINKDIMINEMKKLNYDSIEANARITFKSQINNIKNTIVYDATNEYITETSDIIKQSDGKYNEDRKIYEYEEIDGVTFVKKTTSIFEVRDTEEHINPTRLSIAAEIDRKTNTTGQKSELLEFKTRADYDEYKKSLPADSIIEFPVCNIGVDQVIEEETYENYVINNPETQKLLDAIGGE
jgi:hypothetical protein